MSVYCPPLPSPRRLTPRLRVCACVRCVSMCRHHKSLLLLPFISHCLGAVFVRGVCIHSSKWYRRSLGSHRAPSGLVWSGLTGLSVTCVLRCLMSVPLPASPPACLYGPPFLLAFLHLPRSRSLSRTRGRISTYCAPRACTAKVDMLRLCSLPPLLPPPPPPRPPCAVRVGGDVLMCVSVSVFVCLLWVCLFPVWCMCILCRWRHVASVPPLCTYCLRLHRQGVFLYFVITVTYSTLPPPSSLPHHSL